MPQLVLPKPHPAQAQVLSEAKRFNVLDCGRRWGKTVIGQDRLIQPALHGYPGAWFAPSNKLASPVWRELQTVLQAVTRDISQQERRLELKSGGSIELWSLDDPDAGRGRAYKAVVVDEAAMVKNLETAWVESIRPMLTDYRGEAWFLSTPKGVANYFHTLYQRGQSGARDWASWQMPTSTNPYIDPAEIEDARGDMTDLAFAQEYLAQFVSWAGQVFRRILDAVGEPPENVPAVIIGVDWGRVNDYTVFTAVSQAGDVIGIDRFRGLEYSLQRGRLEAFWRRFGGQAYILAESNNMGGPVVEALQHSDLPVYPFNTTNASKAGIIEALSLAFERGEIRIPNDPVLIGELQAFEARPLPSGLMRYAAPEGCHDDTVLSLAIAWAGLGAIRQQRVCGRCMWTRTLGGCLIGPCPTESPPSKPMKALLEFVDALVARYVQWRIAGEPLNSTRPMFGDQVIAVLRAEVDGRAEELAEFDAELTSRENAAAEDARRAAAIERFQQLGEHGDVLRQ